MMKDEVPQTLQTLITEEADASEDRASGLRLRGGLDCWVACALCGALCVMMTAVLL